AVEQELEGLRSQAHSITDEISNLEHQKDATNRIVNELDRQIATLGRQIDETTVNLLLAQDALAEKRAVLDRRLVDIYKRGLLYQFGPAAGPGNTRITWHGIGIGAPAGTPVRAVAAGTVALVGNMGTYLTSVIVDHGGGYYTFYAYLDDAAVTKGERVLKG